MDLSKLPAKDLEPCNSGEEACARIKQIYDANIEKVNKSFKDLLKGKESSSSCESVYPYVAIEVKPDDLHIDARLSYGVAIDPGVYGSSVTHPEIFEDYYKKQIDLLIKYHKIPVYVGESFEPIPFPFANEKNVEKVTPENINDVNGCFAWPDLDRINDTIPNNTHRAQENEPLPLALFKAERVDFSLHRLHHYTGTHAKHFQNFILLTNYQSYVTEFIEYAKKEVKSGKEYTEFVSPGGHVLHKGGKETGKKSASLPQMPAYHLKREDGSGITFVNIGVGPSNAKTITDHLAVLRPHCWIMLGHCAGLRRSQMLGDYVLAHAYVREDSVLDNDLPLAVPLPAIAEVQVALQEAVSTVTEQKGRELKKRMRTGTVLTTDNRNWELLSQDLFNVFQQTRAIAVDMESATLAANGFRFRVPYGTLLCVSDKPIHGEIKLRSSANAFYQERIHQHLKVGIETIQLLREKGVESLHSRKLRGFEEPPFR